MKVLTLLELRDMRKQDQTGMEALVDPVAIIRSEKYLDTRVVVIRTFRYADWQMNAAILINGRGQENGNFIDSYAITSFYRGDVAAEMLADAIEVEDKGEHTRVYYINKEIAADILGNTGPEGSDLSVVVNGLNHKITDPKSRSQPPNFEEHTNRPVPALVCSRVQHSQERGQNPKDPVH